MNSEYDRKLSESDARAICCEFFKEVMQKTEGMIRLGELTSAERTAALVMQVTGLAINMGLDGLLSDEIDEDPGYSESIKAFDRINAKWAAGILREGLAIKAHLAATGAKDDSEKLLYDLEGEFYELEPDCITKLALFILRLKNSPALGRGKPVS